MKERAENEGADKLVAFGLGAPEPDVPVVLDESNSGNPGSDRDQAEPEETEVSSPEFLPCPPGYIYVLIQSFITSGFRLAATSSSGCATAIAVSGLRELLLAHEHLARPYPLATYSADMSDRWLDLRHRFPNFDQVLNLLKAAMPWPASRPDTPVCFPPILLLANRGVGKSAFSKAVCVAVGIEYGEIPMAGISETFSISGLDLGWSTGRPGSVMEIVSGAGHANPIILHR